MKMRSPRDLTRSPLAFGASIAFALFLGSARATAHGPEPARRAASCGVITLTPVQVPRAVHGLDYATELAASGGLAPYVFTLTGGALPAGIELATGGQLGGVPAVPGAAAFTVTATDADGCTGSASFRIPIARGFCAPDAQVDLPVPAAGSGGTGDPQLDRTTSTLEVSGILEDAIAVVAADVYVTLLHERTGDLVLTLVAPDGTRTRLADRHGGAGQDYFGTCFHAAAGTGICAGSAPFSGSFQPEEPTHLLHPNGTWTLELEDTVSGATGVLLDWSLALETAAAGSRWATGIKYAWHRTVSAPTTNITASETELFVSTEIGSVRCLDRNQNGGNAWERTFFPTPVRSLYVDRSFATPIVAVASEDGFAYGLDAADGTTLWSRDLSRPTCAADSLRVAPLVQLWDRSDCAFRAALTDDLIFFGTDQGCTGTNANRVIAIQSNNGNIRWTFNALGTQQMGGVTGMVGDPARNRLFAVAAKADPSRIQGTVWALNTITGTKLWSKDLGDIAVPPALGDGLFVLSRSGTLAKLDPDTGVVRWSFTLAGGTRTFTSELALDPNQKLLFAVDSAGDLHAVADLGDSAELLWTWAPTETLGEVVVLPHRAWVLTSSTRGRVHQLDKLTGAPLLFGQVPGYTFSHPAPKLQLDGVVGGGRVDCRLMIAGPTWLTRAFTPWAAGDVEHDGGLDLPIEPEARLHLTGTTGPPLLPFGVPVIDELEVTNQMSFLAVGVRAAESVTLTTSLPAGMNLVAVEAEEGTHSLVGQQLTIRLGTLQIGQTTAVRVTLRPLGPGGFVRTYTVSGSPPDGATSDNAVTLANEVRKIRKAP